MMTASRKLVLGALSAGSLLCVYVLCVSLEGGTLSWSTAPLRHLQGLTQVLAG